METSSIVKIGCFLQAGLFADRHPIVLVTPSPLRWMQWVKSMENGGTEQIPDSKEIDAASMYMADFLRAFSQSHLAGIVLEESSTSSLNLMEMIELYQPISNLAEHYQWSFGLHMQDLHEDTSKLKEKVDFILYEENNGSLIEDLWEAGIVSGGGLHREFWTGKPPSENIPVKGIAYGTIPEDAVPEQVLDRLRALRLSS